MLKKSSSSGGGFFYWQYLCQLQSQPQLQKSKKNQISLNQYWEYGNIRVKNYPTYISSVGKNIRGIVHSWGEINSWGKTILNIF